MNKNFKGSLFLISAALVWGLAFVAQKNAAGSIGVFSYIMCRSVVTCAVLIPLCLIRGRGLKRYAPMGPALRRGLVMGVLTFGAISLQQWGMEYTSASKSGFVTALYIVLVPLLGLFFGKKPGLKVWLAVAIALMGAALLSLDFSESLLPGPGEALTFGCALVFSLHILYVDHRAQQLDSTLMCAIQFGVCAVLGGVGAIFEGLTFSQISGNLTSILYVALFPARWATPSSWPDKNTRNPPWPRCSCAWKACSARWAAGSSAAKCSSPWNTWAVRSCLRAVWSPSCPSARRPANFKNRPAWVGFFLPWAKINVIIRTNPLNFFKGVCKK